MWVVLLQGAEPRGFEPKRFVFKTIFKTILLLNHIFTDQIPVLEVCVRFSSRSNLSKKILIKQQKFWLNSEFILFE